MKKLIYCVVLTIFIVGCQKEPLKKPLQNSQNTASQARTAGDVTFCSESSLVDEQNGVLVFPNLNTFRKVMEDIELKHSEWQANGQSEQAEFKISLRFESLFNYSSLRNTIQNERAIWLNNEVLDLATDPDDKWVEGVAIRTLLNSNGAIKVGNSIYVSKPYGETFEVTDGNFQTMNAIISGQTTGLNNTIIHKANGSQIDGNNGNLLSAASDECTGWRVKPDERTYDSGKRKIKGKVWIYNFGAFSNVGSESENFRKVGFVWAVAKARFIETASDGTLRNRYCSEQGYIWIGQSQTNKTQVQETRTYWGQVTKIQPGQYGSFHQLIDGGSALWFTIGL